MSKIERNSRCPCGSNKKYKKCCGSSKGENILPEKDTPTLSLHLNETGNIFGLPGHYQKIHFRAKFRDPSDSRNIGGVVGLPGEYRVTFVLCRPGFSLLPPNNFSPAEKLEGDSHLYVPMPGDENKSLLGAEEILLYATSKEGVFEFTAIPNSRGFLGKIEIKSFVAQSFHDAESKAFHALMPALSNLSLYFDTPLYIYQIDVFELRTNSTSIAVLAPFREKPFRHFAAANLTDEFCKYAGLYREALNNNSTNYQFLCYFKIIEGLRKRRERLTNEAVKRGESIASQPRHKIPNTKQEQVEWLNQIFQTRKKWEDFALSMIFQEKSLGRKVADVVQEDITLIRNKIAHAVLDGGEPTFSIDQATDVNEVIDWLPLTKCIARHYLRIEFPEYF
jgi:hypothetical protein